MQIEIPWIRARKWELFKEVLFIIGGHVGFIVLQVPLAGFFLL
jgi:hypothetical protein